MHGSLLALVSLCVIVGSLAAKQPHIFVILVDDYGWNNIGYHTNEITAKEIITPTLDSLKDQGVELDRHYVYQFCSPTRSAFLSGRNPIHVNVFNDVTNYNPNDTLSGYAGVSLGMTMFPAKLRQAGYATHHTGKWDAGFATTAHLAVNRGYQTDLGYLQHANNYWQFSIGLCNTTITDLWKNDLPAWNVTNPITCTQTAQAGCRYEDDIFVEDVLANLDAHDPAQPLFYHWAPHNIHAPLQVPQNYVDKFSFINNTDRRIYAAMVNHLDDTVAKVVARIKSKGMWDDTLILLFSDNGGPVYQGGGANNYPLRGGKMSNWEGGIRVNAFLSGGFLPKAVQGTKQENFFAVEDWYATFSALAGVDATDTLAAKNGLPPIDGFNQWPLISGATTVSPRNHIWIGSPTDNDTIVQGIILPPWKLLLRQVGENFWQGPLYPNTTIVPDGTEFCTPQGCLFNIIEDPTEHVNQRTAHPEIAANLLAALNEVQKTVFNPNRGPAASPACDVADTKWKGYLGPFAPAPSL